MTLPLHEALAAGCSDGPSNVEMGTRPWCLWRKNTLGGSLRKALYDPPNVSLKCRCYSRRFRSVCYGSEIKLAIKDGSGLALPSKVCKEFAAMNTQAAMPRVFRPWSPQYGLSSEQVSSMAKPAAFA